MKSAIYPGTFDPPTLGHLNVIQRAAKQFDKLIVAIGKNINKNKASFSIEERIQFLTLITKNIPNVEVASFSGLLVDFAYSCGTAVIVRSIRTMVDFEYETAQAQMNRQLSGIETFYLVMDEKYRFLSSSLVREIASYGKPITEFIPSEIVSEIQKKYCD